ITNDRQLTGAQVLAAYRYQPNLERRHHLLKTIQDAAPVWIKTIPRIEAIFMCHFIALLICALIERQIRMAMKAAEIGKIPLYPELRGCAAPSADRIFEYFISVPGYPRRVEGRQNIIDLYSGYGDFMTVRSADNLRVYRDREASVVVLEYEVHGESVQTGRPYNNRFVSIITVKDHKVTHWRDYLDPIAVFHAAGWPGTPPEQSRPSSPV